MEVKLKRSLGIEFCDISMGRCFWCKANPNVYLMKTQITENKYEEINAVNLKTGELESIKANEPVIPFNCELVEV